MPFNKSQFIVYLLGEAYNYESQFGLNPPAADVPDLNAVSRRTMYGMPALAPPIHLSANRRFSNEALR
jgi:hypothetical protein